MVFDMFVLYASVGCYLLVAILFHFVDLPSTLPFLSTTTFTAPSDL